jgi:lipopolysaccharide export LptBFGC system permease protein LptF
VRAWRRVKRRFGISAPRLAVRPHIPWYLRWSMTVPFVLGALALAWWAYGSGLELAGFHRSEAEQELAQLREQVAGLGSENAQLHDQVAQYERQLQIEQASSQEIARQLKVQSDENLSLQEDLAFFQNLTATRGKEGELGVHRLRLERDKMPGEYRLRMLLVRGGQRAKEFAGSYQLVATVLENGQRTTRLFPQDASGNAQFQLGFKYYQRIEQGIQLSPDAQLESVQVRIFEQGVREPRVRQNVSP